MSQTTQANQTNQVPQTNQTNQATKAAQTTRSRARVRSRTRVLPVRIVRGLELSIVPTLILLALREFLPGMEAHLPHVYEFLDGVVVPVWEWGYQLALKGVKLVGTQPWVQQVLAFLKELAI